MIMSRYISHSTGSMEWDRSVHGTDQADTVLFSMEIVCLPDFICDADAVVH